MGKKYSDLIFLDDKKVKAVEKEEAIEDAKVDIINAINASKKGVRSTTKAYNALLASVPLNFSRLIEAQRDLEDAEDQLSRLEALQKELF